MKIAQFSIVPLFAIDIHHVPLTTRSVCRLTPPFFLLLISNVSGSRPLDVTLVPFGYARRV